MALLVGPRLIQQQLTILPFVLTDAPRGLSASLPALVAGTSQQGDVSVSYGGQRLVLAYHCPSLPAVPTDPSGEPGPGVDRTGEHTAGIPSRPHIVMRPLPFNN